MLKSLKSLIDQRLGRLIVQDDLALSCGYFIKVDPNHLNPALYFLKHDPDTLLNILDQIIVINTHTLPWEKDLYNPKSTHEIIYQLKSLKLPYRVSLVVETFVGAELIPSVTSMYYGAAWLERDIQLNYGFEIDELERDNKERLQSGEKSPISIDNNLLISRFQQKELYLASHDTSQLSLHKIEPFINQTPINIGINLWLFGNKIISSKLETGYLQCGIEKLLSQSQDTASALSQAQRINRRTPIFYQLPILLASEQLLSIEPSDEIKKQRAIAIEIARIYHHLKILKNLFISIKADNLYEFIADALLLWEPIALLGARIYPAATTTPPAIKNHVIIASLESLIPIIDNIEIELNNNESYLILRKKALITLIQATSMGLSGHYIRAHRNHYDLRASNTFGLDYGTPPKLNISEGGDALARTILRIKDVQSSSRWLSKQHKDFQPLIEDPAIDWSKTSSTLAFGEIEGPEGNIKASIFKANEQKLPLIFLRIPAYFIAQAIPHLLANSQLSDLAMILNSLGISAEEIDK